MVCGWILQRKLHTNLSRPHAGSSWNPNSGFGRVSDGSRTLRSSGEEALQQESNSPRGSLRGSKRLSTKRLSLKDFHQEVLTKRLATKTASVGSLRGSYSRWEVDKYKNKISRIDSKWIEIDRYSVDSAIQLILRFSWFSSSVDFALQLTNLVQIALHHLDHPEHLVKQVDLRNGHRPRILRQRDELVVGAVDADE